MTLNFLSLWESYGHGVTLFEGCADWQQAILTDPQASGGLLVSCSAEVADQVLAIFKAHHFETAAVIGRLGAGSAGVVVSA